MATHYVTSGVPETRVKLVGQVFNFGKGRRHQIVLVKNINNMTILNHFLWKLLQKNSFCFTVIIIYFVWVAKRKIFVEFLCSIYIQGYH